MSQAVGLESMMVSDDSESDILSDSQSSDSELSDFVTAPEWPQPSEEIQLSDTDDELLKDDMDDDGDENYIGEGEQGINEKENVPVSGVDRILQRVKRPKLAATSTPSPSSTNTARAGRWSSEVVRSGQAKHPTIQEFSLGRSFDSSIAEKMEQMNRVHEMLDDPVSLNAIEDSSTGDSQNIDVNDPAPEKADTFKEIKRRYKIMLKSNGNNVDLEPAVMDLICKDQTGRYRDWFFITKNCQLPLQTFTGLRYFLLSLGVEPEKLEDDFVMCDDDINKFDTYCHILPPDFILDAFTVLPMEPNSFKWWLLLILDKNFFDATNCTIQVCGKMMIKFLKYYGSVNKVLEIFWDTLRLEKRKYYMLYRFTKVLPSFKEKFMKELFQDDDIKLVNEFNQLFDSQNYQDLLYFILFIYGSELFPFNNKVDDDEDNIGDIVKERKRIHKMRSSENIHEYFTDCIFDVSNGGHPALELPIILGILKIFSIKTQG